MSKTALLLAVPGALALTALAVWNVTLQSEIDGLRAKGDDSASTGRADAAAGATDAASQDRVLPGMTERTSSRFRELEQRLLEMERGMAKPAGAMTKAPAMVSAAGVAESGEADMADMAEGAEGAADAEHAALAGVDPVFKAQVYAVMDQREAERRKERQQRDAERLAERMLRGIDVTDAQKTGVVEILAAQATRRDELRRDEDLVPEDTRARMAELAVERDRALENLLGVELANTIKSRAQAGRRQGDGQRGRLPRVRQGGAGGGGRARGESGGDGGDGQPE